ncbi:MAG: hypothetical protein MJE66_13480 [Proteobacteria bacterium]|nr:hypothetical protein [Pseudomonadota bacterium]
MAAAVAGALALAGIGWALLSFAPTAEIWEALAPGDCAEYCEAHDRCGVLATRAPVQQPVNAVSSGLYLAAGAWVYRRRRDALGLLLLASGSLLAVGSFLFHAAVAVVFNGLDVVGIYACLLAVVARGWHANFGGSPARVAAAFLALNPVLAAGHGVLTIAPLAAVLLVALALLFARYRGRTGASARTAWAAAVLLVAGFALHKADQAKLACAPDGLLQAHTLWHACTALALALGDRVFAGGRSAVPPAAP